MANSYYLKNVPGARRYLPRIRVSFHTEEKCYQVFGKISAPGEEHDPTFQLISVNTTKTLHTPVGAFNVVLAGDDWIDILKSNDLVVISMGYAGEKLDTVMIGLIDSVRRSRRMSDDGKPSVTTVVSGRDMGKMLVKPLLKFYPEIGMSDLAKQEHKFFLTEDGWKTLMEHFTGKVASKGTPAVLLDTVMRFILSKLTDVQWTVWDETKSIPTPKKLTLQHIIRYSFAKTEFFLPFIMTLTEYEGSVWNLMERACIKPFCELFIDVRDTDEAWNPTGVYRVVPEEIEQSSDPSKGTLPKDQGQYVSPAHQFGDDKAKVVLALRNTPFDKPNWDKLVKHKLSILDVINEDLGHSDDEHYNLFWAGEKLSPFGIDLKRVAPPTFNEAEAKRYGLSPLEISVEGFALDPSKPDQQLLLQAFTNTANLKLQSWFGKNHELWNGTLEVRGRGNYRIGHALEYDAIGREFYIEGVSQSFQMYIGWKTNLTVTRGMPIGQQPQPTTVSITVL